MSPRTDLGKPLVHVLAAELRHLREEAGLSQNELGRLMGYGSRTIKRWEKGDQAPRDAVLKYLRSLKTPSPAFSAPESTSFRFIDLFAGIGGFRLALEAVGGRCVFTSEQDKYCQQTYRANFGDHAIAGDIRQVEAAEIPEHDLLVAGFPCQPFSLAGVSKKNSLGRAHGFLCETQGTLFFEIERLLRHHRPKAFLLENVKNLTSHDGGNTFRVILDTLRNKLGYRVWAKVLDARHFVPQHRERIFLVGFRDDMAFDWGPLATLSRVGNARLSAILHSEDGTEAPEPPYTGEGGRVAGKYVLSSHLWRYLRDYAARHREQGNGFGFGLVGPEDVARTLSARYYKDGSEILIRRGRGNPRRLTPRECARLMGFDRAKPFVIPVSDTQAYKQFGNAVVVPLAEAIARRMYPGIVGKHEPAQLTLDLPAVG